MQYFRNP